MRTVLHVSDPHFGKADPAVISLCLAEAARIKPDLVVISGDITQIAKGEEFEAARGFVEAFRALGSQVFVIPGNHDVRSFYAPLARAFTPYDRYHEYIDSEVEPRYIDEDLAICAIDTVRRERIANGSISEKQIERTREWFAALHTDQLRIVVSHHPLDLPPRRALRPLAFGAKAAINGLASSGIDIYLAGHHHHSYAILTSDRYPNLRPAIAVGAGTVSMREYGEPQSFNVLYIDRTYVQVNAHRIDEDQSAFEIASTWRFAREKGAWRVVEGDTAIRFPLEVTFSDFMPW